MQNRATFSRELHLSTSDSLGFNREKALLPGQQLPRYSTDAEGYIKRP